DQHQRQTGTLKQLLQANGRQLVGKLNLDAIETGHLGNKHTFGQRQFTEQHGKVGGNLHRLCSRNIFTSVAGSCSRCPWLPCRRSSCAARPVMGVALPSSRDSCTAVSRSLSRVRTCHLMGSNSLAAICGARICSGFESAKPPARAGAIRLDRKSTRLNSSHVKISYAVF